MRFTRSEIVTLLLLGLILIAVTLYAVYSVRSKPAENNPTPAMAALQNVPGAASFTDTHGNPTDLTSRLGNVLVVNIWASWSPSSKEELTWLAKLASEYESEGVNVLAINRGESPNNAERFLQTLAVDDRLSLVLDPDDRYYNSVGGYAMPETIIYDADGNIVQHIRGEAKEAQVREYLETILRVPSS